MIAPINRKAKTYLWAALLLAAALGCFALFILGIAINVSRVPAPTSSTTGTVIKFVKGANTRPSRQTDSCTYAYKVEGETYTLSTTCGGFGDRDGDKAEIIYSVANPQDAYVNRQSFFNLFGCLGIPIAILGLFLFRKATRLRYDEY
jgi:hypothetical protein